MWEQRRGRRPETPASLTSPATGGESLTPGGYPTALAAGTRGVRGELRGRRTEAPDGLQSPVTGEESLAAGGYPTATAVGIRGVWEQPRGRRPETPASLKSPATGGESLTPGGYPTASAAGTRVGRGEPRGRRTEAPDGLQSPATGEESLAAGEYPTATAAGILCVWEQPRGRRPETPASRGSPGDRWGEPRAGRISNRIGGGNPWRAGDAPRQTARGARRPGEPRGWREEPLGWRGAETDSVKSPTAGRGAPRRYTDGPEQEWSVAQTSASSVAVGSSTMNGAVGEGTKRRQRTRPCVACSRTGQAPCTTMAAHAQVAPIQGSATPPPGCIGHFRPQLWRPFGGEFIA